jgi:hypothetical protein
VYEIIDEAFWPLEVMEEYWEITPNDDYGYVFYIMFQNPKVFLVRLQKVGITVIVFFSLIVRMLYSQP